MDLAGICIFVRSLELLLTYSISSQFMGLVVPMVFNHFQSNSISIWHSSGELRQICKGKSGRKDFKMVHPFPWGATESRCSSHAHIVQNPWDIRCRVWYLEEYIWWWIRGSWCQIWDPPNFEHQSLDIRLEILYVHPRRPPPLPPHYKGWGQNAKLGPYSAIWGKLGTGVQGICLNPCTKFPPNPTSRKVNT